MWQVSSLHTGLGTEGILQSNSDIMQSSVPRNQ